MVQTHDSLNARVPKAGNRFLVLCVILAAYVRASAVVVLDLGDYVALSRIFGVSRLDSPFVVTAPARTIVGADR